ncbi:unnamed protein product, partial [Laminaria digitata]
AVEFPASYSLFLSWINVLNFDLGYILSASCVLPSVNFYQQLLATTIAPFVVAAGLVLTYYMAKPGRAGHAPTAYTLLYVGLVFTSTSSTVLKTFACDNDVMEGESYLRADYSISCNTHKHGLFRKYAGLMVVVYPVGIPVLYFFVLWRKRKLLNPRIYSANKEEVDGDSA